ncbi:MAG: SsrA-binding protein [Candidatus Magasanikbacteria bacterium RIFCSPHIGHO2_02_FULL_41_13]|uniref:SsrA-binding protein n=1 Tax=Candidatus Magasanikbacteria bacterium RIFCSPHIGHO2_02_FULL_41_13 TaxID=1798676 RepID=A0A1F6M6X4_9BACT|nr:MAG: SsrA-binding protein [Candidatus Magasanikbacteria bacterium RIFCSPHIGHO2_02_FULL_41_13]
MSTLASNKKANFDYTILQKFEAGLVLSGQEVKSIRSGAARLSGAFITFHGNEAMLTNAFIPPYKHASHLENYIPDASRKILLKKREIDLLRGKLQQKGLTIVPLSLYTKGQLIKIEIGLAQGKKTFDKRQTIKEREGKREIARKMKDQ